MNRHSYCGARPEGFTDDQWNAYEAGYVAALNQRSIAPNGEPAAWMWIDKEDGIKTFWSFKGDSETWEYVPLYLISPATGDSTRKGDES